MTIHTYWQRRCDWLKGRNTYCAMIRFLMVFFLFPCAQAETLKVGVSADLLAFRGFSMEKVECAFQLAGYHLEAVELPIERSYQSVQSGVVDVDLLRVKVAVEGANNIVHIPTPVLTVEKWIYYRLDGNKVTPENMKAHVMIPIIGVHYYDQYREAGFPMLDSVVALDSAFKMLNAGRGDYVVWTRDGREVIEALGIVDNVGQQQLGQGEPLYTILHDRHKAKIPKLNNAYERVFSRNDCPL